MKRSRASKIEPVPDDVIADIVAKMAEECSFPKTYKVADNAEIDWCPCCGVNIRLRLNGKLFAKFVCSPAISKQIGAKLLTVAYRAEEIQSDPIILKQAVDGVIAAAKKQAAAWDEEDCPGHVASSLNPKICRRCGIHIDSLRPEDEQPEGER